MKKHLQYIIYLFVLNVPIANAQLLLSERVQYSQLATPDDKSLFLVEFWATWCAPCINVSKYLNVLQEKYAKDFYVVSLSQEPSGVIKKFLQKYTTKLAVSIDYDGENFRKYSVNALPYGVLLNAKGEILWQGNPSNLKDRDLDFFLSTSRIKSPIYQFLKYKSYETEQPNSIDLNGEYHLSKSDFETGRIPLIEQSAKELITIQGSLQQIVSYLLNINQKQVIIPKKINTPYRLTIHQNTNKKHVLENIKKELNITHIEEERKGQILELQLISSEKLWDTTQINWGYPNSKYLVDDHQITADDMTIGEFISLISEFYETPIELISHNNERYDWQIHYKFSNLLLNNLNDYGFETTTKEGEYPIFLFQEEK